MERNRHYGVKSLVSRQRESEQVPQRTRKRRNPAVLEKIDEIPKGAFVRPVAICRVKTAKAAAAQSAAAFGIQRKSVLKRRSTTYTEIIGSERLGYFQTVAANGDSADLQEGLCADPAIVGKQKGKKGVRGCPN